MGSAQLVQNEPSLAETLRIEALAVLRLLDAMPPRGGASEGARHLAALSERIGDGERPELVLEVRPLRDRRLRRLRMTEADGAQARARSADQTLARWTDALGPPIPTTLDLAKRVEEAREARIASLMPDHWTAFEAIPGTQDVPPRVSVRTDDGRLTTYAGGPEGGRGRLLELHPEIVVLLTDADPTVGGYADGKRLMLHVGAAPTIRVARATAKGPVALLRALANSPLTPTHTKTLSA